MNTETPIRRQYLEIKAKHKDSLLLFRLGDFYEAFDEDARILAKELDIVLTSRAMGKSERIPLAGVPHFVLERHLATLIARGHRVAICEQTGTEPVKNSEGKKLIPREVVRVVTAGTILEPALLQSKANNYLCAFVSDGLRSGIAYADVTTGDFAATEVENADALTELQRLAPAEILLAETEEILASKKNLPAFITKFDAAEFTPARAKQTLFKHFNTKTLQPFGLEKLPLATGAAGALIAYLRKTQTSAAEQLTRLTCYDSRDFMLLDGYALRSLEVFDSATGTSLLSVIDRTRTAFGGRLLRRWLRQPLLDTTEIYRRQEHVAAFKENSDSRAALADILAEVKDLERLSSRAKANCITPFELRALGKSLELIPQIKSVLRADESGFKNLLAHLPECEKSCG